VIGCTKLKLFTLSFVVITFVLPDSGITTRKSSNQDPAMKRKITVVDDETDLRNLLRLTLSMAGYDVEVFSNGEDFVNQSNFNSDLYIIDIDLGKMTGLDVCRFLKSSKATGPVIMISADPEIRSLAEEACADGSLAKPFSQSGLLQKIDSYLK
jgi:DNA-binding response OmpR family regulator